MADDIALDAWTPSTPGKPLAVRGTAARAPARRDGARLLERSPASVPLDLEAVPALPGPRRDKVLLANHRRANRFEVVGARAGRRGRVRATLDLPKELPRGRLRLRIVATTGEEQVIRVQSLEVIRREE